MQPHKIVSREEWTAARDGHEKGWNELLGKLELAVQ